MKIIGLLLQDFTKSKFFRVIAIIFLTVLVLWALVVPSTFILNEVYTKIPIVQEMVEGETVFSGSYTELFYATLESPAMFLFGALFGLLLIFTVSVPFIIIGFALILLLGLIVCIIGVVQYIRNTKYHIRRVKKYFKNLNERAKGIK